MSYIRARREDQKAERREGILNTARDLCAEFGILDWSLNELGRRADITKSNLYRYFGSREEILMVLMHEEIAQFAQALSEKTANAVLTVPDFCQLMAKIYTKHPMLCDLLSVSSTVLEKNTDLDPILQIKRAGAEHERIVVSAIASCLDGVNETTAAQIAFASGIIVSGLWPMAAPAAPIRQLSEFEGFEHLAMDFCSELQRMLEAHVFGILHRTQL